MRGVQKAGPPYTGTIGVACDKEGDAIEYVAYYKEAPYCTAKLGPQQGGSGLALANTGIGSKRGIAISGEAKGLEYELSGGCTTGSSLHTDGGLGGETTLSGEDEEAGQVGAWLAGEA